MCPESERLERERTRDLSEYERLDGSLNKTSIDLAVKKYNLISDIDATLIRPVPVLLRTIDYLLNFTNHPYDDKFQSIYNFVSNRMQAIQMDFRMQHIISPHAITTHEYMIRFHIIAMHELCECKKGKECEDGFDTQLANEQINASLIDLFQMYDEQRKKGIPLSTEKEFQGYYALLNLHDDDTGGNMLSEGVSPNLPKLTAEIKASREVRYAYHVKKACKTGNYIAFFQLARRATYLQACLMHGHFAKLRTQGLASLHSGLRDQKGIPIARVVRQLAMEGEGIESFLEYHGFKIKMHDEVKCMIKEGKFLNGDIDYPSKYSKLIQRKRSRRIIDDMSSDPNKPVVSIQQAIQFYSDKIPIGCPPDDVNVFEENCNLACKDKASEDFDHKSTEVISSDLNKPAVPTDLNKPAVPTDLNKPAVPNDLIKPAVPTDLNKPAVPTDLNKPAVPTDRVTEFLNVIDGSNNFACKRKVLEVSQDVEERPVTNDPNSNLIKKHKTGHTSSTTSAQKDVLHTVSWEEINVKRKVSQLSQDVGQGILADPNSNIIKKHKTNDTSCTAYAPKDVKSAVLQDKINNVKREDENKSILGKRKIDGLEEEIEVTRLLVTNLMLASPNGQTGIKYDNDFILRMINNKRRKLSKDEYCRCLQRSLFE